MSGAQLTSKEKPSGSGNSSRTPPRVRMTGQERREQLLDVGRVLFAEKGYEPTSIEEIAERAKISKPIVYEHFGGKQGLYAVIVDREVQELLGRITAALDAEHPRLMLQQAAQAFLAYIEGEPDGSASPGGMRRERALLLLIVAAFVASAAFAIAQHVPFENDETVYATQARAWAAGGPVTGVGLQRAPLLPAIGSLIYKAGARSEWPFRLTGLV